MRAVVCRLVLVGVLGVTWVVALIGRVWGLWRRRVSGRVLVTGTFYNHNWFLSHATPLGVAGLGDVVFVADELMSSPDGVRVVCPPRWMMKVCGRALSKLIWMTWIGLRDGADVFMGYHIFPGALSALVAARICRGRACYQMTGGPIEMAGGGWQAENPVMAGLGRPSRVVEWLMTRVVREFDAVVVRGSGAAAFVKGLGARGRVDVIPGSVAIPDDVREQGERRVDMVFVGRLGAIKRPLLFVEAVGLVREKFPDVRAVMIGGGEMEEEVRQAVVRLGLDGNVEVVGQSDEVASVLADAKVFVLTSSSEGLSISMLEAMAAGAVAIVSDVGELSDVVRDGETGHLIASDGAAGFAAIVERLLSDDDLRVKLSRAGREAVVALASLEAVGECWRACLGDWTTNSR